MPTISHRGRPGFTLLEVLLATMIGVLLMGALYVAVDVQLKHAQAARNVAEQSMLARSLLSRISSDIMPTIGPPMPTPTSSSGGSGAGGTAAAGTGASPSTSGTTGAGATGATPSSGAASTASSGQTSTSSVQVNIGVQGDPYRLTLSISRVPRDLTPTQENPAITSDQSRIHYWLVTGGDQPLGLARLEIKEVTSEEAAALVPPDIPDEPTYIIAEEVKSLTFSYFNGTDWQDTWDGTAAGSDGMTPIGPPLAIAIVIGIGPPGGQMPAGGMAGLKFYRHVIAIPTANGTSQPTSTTGQ